MHNRRSKQSSKRTSRVSILSSIASERNNSRLVLHPDGKFKRYWNLLTLLLAIYSIVVAPFQMAFPNSEISSLSILDLLLDSLFFIDMIVSCFTGYYDDKFNIEYDIKKIICHYLKTWFLFDLISCFPVQIIVDSNSGYEGFTRFKRLWRMIRMVKLLRFLKFFKTDHRKNIHLALKLSIQLERLMFLWLLISFLIHLLACVWTFLGNVYEEKSNSFMVRYKFVDYSNTELYVTSIYFIVTTLVTVGYGDITAITITETVVCWIIMILGIIIYSGTISSISNIISSLDTRKHLLNQKLDNLNNLARKYKLGNHFYNKLSHALEYEHRNYDKELEDILLDLPIGLKLDLIHKIHEEKVCRNHFFKERSLAFIAWAAERLHPVLIKKNEYVYKKNEYANEMYFILKGKLSLNLRFHGQFYPFIYLQENYFFGEIDLLFSNNKNHMNSVKAEETSELLTLSREDFEEMLSHFEDEAIEICVNARKRLDRIHMKQLEAERELEKKSAVRPIISIPMKNNVNVNEVRTIARKSIHPDAVIKCSSLYKDIKEEKNPENFVKVIKQKLKKINLYTENIGGLSNELLEMVYLNKAQEQE